ncbi:MAG: hypothetical protein HZB26_09485 [Candidatus Hydrogenedentes bacterium]|nr:hypothetical protein [Candidatus Hydrogenedentota bacterium]
MTQETPYRQKMQEIEAADEIFQAGWKSLRPNHSARETYRLLDREYEKRNQVVAEFYELLSPLWGPFLSGAPKAVDAVLDFLEVDVPAFRVGYAKEWFYRRLKRVPLSEQQRSRLLDIAIAILGQPGYRREWLALSRLLIVLADGTLISRLERLSRLGETDFVKRRATLVLEKVIANSKVYRGEP